MDDVKLGELKFKICCGFLIFSYYLKINPCARRKERCA
jgi:hypothetical protein